MWSTLTTDMWQASHVDVDVERSSPESVGSVTATGASGGDETDSPPPTHQQPPPAKERDVKGSDVITPSADKPSLSYIALISGVIMAAPGERILLNDIYSAITTKYPYYGLTTDKAWKNSIRHNLSLNECFIKSGRADNGKGNYWAVHPACLADFRRGDFRRRQARRKSKRCTKTADGVGVGVGVGYVDYRTLTLPYRYDVGYAPMSAPSAGPTPTCYQPLRTEYVMPTASQPSATSPSTMTSLTPSTSYQYSLTSYSGYLQAHGATTIAPPNVDTRQLGSSYLASGHRTPELTVSQRPLSQLYHTTPSLYPNGSGFYQKDRNFHFR